MNGALNSYRLGRMVRRLCEIETYRAMALLALPEARRRVPFLSDYDRSLADLASRNVAASSAAHKAILDEISGLSARIVSAAASTRTRFGATAAYAKIVEERIGELREAHIAGFQRFRIFVARRFKPAIRTCEATAPRLEQMSHATMHLIDLLQTGIQVDLQHQNVVQMQSLAERAATQLKIQRAVEGLSIISISYYLLGLLKIGGEAMDYAGWHVPPIASIPVAIAAVGLAIWKVRKALKGAPQVRT